MYLHMRQFRCKNDKISFEYVNLKSIANYDLAIVFRQTPRNNYVGYDLKIIIPPPIVPILPKTW